MLKKKLILFLNLMLFFIVGCSKKELIPNDHGTIAAIQNNAFFDKIGNVTPYNESSVYADQMSECVYANTSEKSCTVSDLPLIGIVNDKIKIQDILDRTMISHEFLGVAFKEVLLKMNPEVLQMFGAVSAIVISDKINPSFYYRTSGAIYLSGRYFWRTEAEKKIVTQVKDYRAGADLPFQFLFENDYIKNGKSITSREVKNFQSYDEMTINTSKLLFHELTHANDYFPKSFYKSSQIDLNKTYQKIGYQRFIKNELPSMNQPTMLTSKLLNHIGQILFQGDDATASDSLITADDVIKELRNDTSVDPYSYSSEREDLAMNAEEALMLYYYNIPRIVAVIRLPKANFIIPDDFTYPVAWGQISRVLNPKIKARAIFAVENSLGKIISNKVNESFENSSHKEIPADTPWEDLYAL